MTDDEIRVNIKDVIDGVQKIPPGMKIVSPLTKKALSNSDIAKLRTITNRHMPSDDEDIFGRIDLEMCISEKLNNEKWPILPIITILQTGDAMLDAYRSHADKLLKQYASHLIEKKLMISRSDLKNYNLIDTSTLFPLSQRHTKAEKASRPKLEFSDYDFEQLYEAGWKVFIPRFKTLFIKTNVYKYLFVETENVDYEHQTIQLHVKTYLGDSQVWMTSSECRFILKFENNSCEIETLESIPYEKNISCHINEMNWDKKTKQFWCDLFDVPKNWNDIAIATLDELQSQELGFGTDVGSVILYDKTEQALLKKMYGRYITISQNEKVLSDTFNSASRGLIIPDFVQAMCVIYLHFKEYNAPTDITKLDNNMLLQKFGRASVTSLKPFIQ